MESVEWIFTDHRTHLSMLQLLKEQHALLENDAMSDENKDEEISGMVLAAPRLDGMPHAHGKGSSTEWVAMKLNSIHQDRQALANEIQRYCQLLRLYDAVVRTLNADERWFVEKYYDEGYSLASLPALADSPFQERSRSTMSNYRKRLLQKAEGFFAYLQGIGS